MISKPTVATVTMTTANTEYSYSIPAGTRKIEVKLRALNALLYVYFTSGGSDYFTVPYGDRLVVEAKCGGSTLYLKSPSAAMTAEILTWR